MKSTDILAQAIKACEIRRDHAETFEFKAGCNACLAAVRELAPIASASDKAIGWLYDWTHSSALGKPDENFTSFTTKREEAFRPTCTNQRQVSLTN